MDNELLIKNIKLIRIKKKISQRKVQKDTGISQSTLSRYECGKSTPKLVKFIILADYYETSTDFLLERTSNHERF